MLCRCTEGRRRVWVAYWRCLSSHTQHGYEYSLSWSDYKVSHIRVNNFKGTHDLNSGR